MMVGEVATLEGCPALLGGLGLFLVGKKVDGGPLTCQGVGGGWRWKDKAGGWEDV